MKTDNHVRLLLSAILYYVVNPPTQSWTMDVVRFGAWLSLVASAVIVTLEAWPKIRAALGRLTD